MFQDKEFYIVNGPSSHSKAVLEEKVAEVFFTINLSFYQHFMNRFQHLLGQYRVLVSVSVPLKNIGFAIGGGKVRG